MQMLGLDVMGADENALIDSAAAAAKGLNQALKKPPVPAPEAAPGAQGQGAKPGDKKGGGKTGKPDDGFFSAPVLESFPSVKRWHAAVAAAVTGLGGWWWHAHRKG